jgi:ATP-dependent DNA helicase Rep
MELLDWIAKIQKSDKSANLPEIIQRMMLMDMLKRNEDQQQPDAVQLMTLHAAKGLEFPHVYLVGFEEELLPHMNSIHADTIEEERRLAYVGITRAQKTLCMTMAKVRSRYGEKMMCEPSRFLEELPPEDIEWQGGKATEKTEQKKGRAQLDGLKAMLS